jgi:hypothetical protein
VTGLVIRSGGQSGVDRAALDVAIARDLPYTGWCPRGGWAEDLTMPPGVLARYPSLAETPSSEPAQRTAWNVRDSHASLMICREADLDASDGTRFGVVCAQVVFMRPYYVADLHAPEARRGAAAWLDGVIAALGADPFVLSVGGPRESESPGIYAASFDFLFALLAAPRERFAGE